VKNARNSTKKIQKPIAPAQVVPSHPYIQSVGIFPVYLSSKIHCNSSALVDTGSRRILHQILVALSRRMHRRTNRFCACVTRSSWPFRLCYWLTGTVGIRGGIGLGVLAVRVVREGQEIKFSDGGGSGTLFTGLFAELYGVVGEHWFSYSTSDFGDDGGEGR